MTGLCFRCVTMALIMTGQVCDIGGDHDGSVFQVCDIGGDHDGSGV